MTVGAVRTVRTAAVEVADPVTLVNTARKRYPFMPGLVVTLYVVDVAPAMSSQVEPESVERCHCTVGAGLPVAAAVNDAAVPVLTV
jgi:hypothetical protein